MDTNHLATFGTNPFFEFARHLFWSKTHRNSKNLHSRIVKAFYEGLAYCQIQNALRSLYLQSYKKWKKGTFLSDSHGNWNIVFDTSPENQLYFEWKLQYNPKTQSQAPFAVFHTMQKPIQYHLWICQCTEASFVFVPDFFVNRLPIVKLLIACFIILVSLIEFLFLPFRHR